MRITKRQLRQIIKEEKAKLQENANAEAIDALQNAERMQGLYSDVAAIETLQKAFDDLLKGTEADAANDFGEDDEEGYTDAAEAAVTLTVAQIFKDADMWDQYDALMDTLR
jgi:hypothetical protein